MTNYNNLSTSGDFWNKSYQIKEQGTFADIKRHALSFADMPTKVAGDSVDTVPIGAGEFVYAVYATVITVSGTASSTFNVGDSASATQYLSGVSATATGTTFAAATTQKFYSTANAVRVTLGTTAPQNGLISVGSLTVVIPAFANA